MMISRTLKKNTLSLEFRSPTEKFKYFHFHSDLRNCAKNFFPLSFNNDFRNCAVNYFNSIVILGSLQETSGCAGIPQTKVSVSILQLISNLMKCASFTWIVKIIYISLIVHFSLDW